MAKQKIEKRPGIKHKYIVAWGKYMDSMDYYIEDMLLKAQEDNAPAGALYQDKDGKWFTIDEVKNPALQASLQDYVKFMKP